MEGNPPVTSSPGTVVDLGKKVKAKYPGTYDGIDDAEVGRRVKAKHPEAYGGFSEIEATPPFVQAPKAGAYGPVVKKLAEFGAPPTESPMPSPMASDPSWVPASKDIGRVGLDIFDPTFSKSAGQAFTKQEVAQAAPNKRQEAQERAFFNERFAPLDQKGVTQYREQVLPQERVALKQAEQGMLADAQALEQSAAQIEQMRQTGDPAYEQAIKDHNQGVALLQKQRASYEDMARKLDRDERMLDMQEYGIKAQTGSTAGAYWNNALNSVGQSVSGFNSPMVDFMLFLDPAVPREGESQDAANNRVKERLRAGMRSAPGQIAGDSETTNEYIDELGRGSFFHEAALGATGSVPTFFMGPGGLGLMTQAMDNTDALMEGPEFDDIDPLKKRLFSSTVGAVTGQLERAGLRNAAMNKTIVGRILKEAAEQIPPGTPAQEVSRIMRREVDSRGLNAAMQGLVGGASEEAITEGAQALSENALKDAFNALEGRQVFDTPEGVEGYVTDVFRAAAQGAIGGTMYAAPGGISRAMRKEGLGAKTTPKEFEMVEALIKDPNFRESYAEQQAKDVEEGKLTPAQAEQINEDLDKATAIIDKIPDDLSPESRKQAFDLLVQREALRKKDPALVATKVEAINEKLRALEGVPKTPEPTTNQDGTTTDPKPVQPTGEEVVQNSLLPDPQAQQVDIPASETTGLGPEPVLAEGATSVAPDAALNEPAEAINEDQSSEQATAPTDLGTPTGVPNEPAAPSPAAPVEPQQVKKTFATKRSYEGEFREEVKAEIEKLGLYREVENQAEAEQAADAFIQQVGIDAAFDAAIKGDIRGGARSVIRVRKIEDLDRQILEETDEARKDELTREQARLIQETDQVFLEQGRESSMMRRMYETSDLGFKSSVKAQEWQQEFGEAPPADLMAKWRERDKELEELQKKLADAERRAEQAAGQGAVDAIKESIAREKARGAQRQRKQLADKIRSLKIPTKGVTGAFIIPPPLFNAAIEAVALAVQAGQTIAEAIAKGIQKLREDKWHKEQNEQDQKNAEALFEATINGGLEDSAGEGRIKIPKQAIRDAVARGVKDIDSLVQVMKELVSDIYPDATDREVRDAITDYGRVVNMSMDDISVEVRRMRRIGRIISAMEDVRNKIRPLRSGLQRDKLDAEERALAKELREAMKELPVDEAAQERELKTALDAAKTRARNRIEDLQREIDTKERIERKGIPVKPDAELEQLLAERDRLREEWSEIFQKEGPSDEERLAMSISATKRRLEEYERRIREKDLETKKPTPVKETPELKALRESVAAAKKEYQQLQEDTGLIEKRRTETAKTAARTRMAELERRLKERDFSVKTRKRVVADSELIKLQAEKLRLKEEYDREFYKEKLRNRTKWERAKDAAIEAWGLGRALQATGELSFVLLQGGALTLSNALRKPSVVAKAFKNSLEAFASESRSEEWLRKIKSQEWYPIAKEAKLAITEPKAELTAREELFVSDWTRFIWNAIGSPLKLKSKEAHEKWKKANPFKALERASVGYLDTLRVERFLDGLRMLDMKKADGQEVSRQEYKDIADAINTLTGRSGLGKAEPIAKPLAQIFFSPRMWASRFKTGTPYALYWFSKLTPTARKMALLDYSRYIGLTTAVVATAAFYLNGDDDDETNVELDPRSSDFMKIRIGNTRIDPWGGHQPQVVASTKLVLGTASLFMDEPLKAHKTLGGELYPLGRTGKSPTLLEVMSRMATNKLSPSAALLVEGLSTKVRADGTRIDSFGKEYNMGDRVLEKTYPIFASTVNELMQDDPQALDGFLLFYAFLGGGVSVYEDKPKKK